MDDTFPFANRKSNGFTKCVWPLLIEESDGKERVTENRIVHTKIINKLLRLPRIQSRCWLVTNEEKQT